VTYPKGTGGAPDLRAIWRQQRERWRKLPERTRRGVILALQVLVFVLLVPWWWGFAALVAVFFALYWIPHDLAIATPWRKIRVRAAITPSSR